MTDFVSEKYIAIDEVYSFVNRLEGWWSNGNIFFACRKIQRESQEQGILIMNALQVYHWLIEIRDLLKKEMETKTEKKISNKNRNTDIFRG